MDQLLLLCSNGLLLITGKNKFILKKILGNVDQVSFENVKSYVSELEIKKTILLSNEILVLYDKTIQLHDFEDSLETFSFESELQDISAFETGHALVVFLLCCEGTVYYEHLRSLQIEERGFENCLYDFIDSLACSIFYSQMYKTIFVGHKNNVCSMINVQNISSKENIRFNGVQRIKVKSFFIPFI